MGITTLGVDIGGSGIKGAPVDIDAGDFAEERFRIETPQPSTPSAVADVVADVVANFAGTLDAREPIGVTIPAPSLHGTVPMMANLDHSWVGVDAREIFTERLGRPVRLVNDADAAGVAEANFGAARGVDGLVIVTTLGTGIGTALLYRGVLIPNTELGHLEIDGHDAETQAAASVREKLGLKYAEWAPRLQRYYEVLEMLFSPDLIVVGGGVSKKAEKFLPLLQLRASIVPAALENRAGIIGAAYLAHTDPLG